MSNYVLEVKNVGKTFPGVKALDNVSIQVKKGQVHALVGENGAGKSTLMKILNGNYTRDCGEILVDGKPVEIKNPQMARALGISIIFQEFNLVPTLTVAENLFVGRLPKKGRFIDWKRLNEQADQALKRIGYTLDPTIMVSKLTVAQMQMVEIAKAVSYENTKILLMDEPSATLTNKECAMMFDVVRELKNQGIAVIYISHRLEEIFEICEWVTVLRDGQVVGSRPIEELSKDDITEMMIGRELRDVFPKRPAYQGGEVVLEVENIHREGVLQNINFKLYRGEVLGLAGLVGAGRTEIARAITGIDHTDSGTVKISGKQVNLRNPFDVIRHGMCYLSEDRKREGVVGTLSVKWNLDMSSLKKTLSAGMINPVKEKKMAQRSVEAMAIKTPNLEQTVFRLSGGNQQKIVIGKWLNTDADIYIFDEPTRGIDVGAKYEIYVLMNKLIQEGKSIIMISSELPEVLGMCDRVLIIKDGGIAKELTGAEITAQSFIKYAI